MRMWLVPPSHMCRKHLLGEHVELHMLLGTLKKGKSITGFLSGGLVDPCRMYKRHGELVREMERRGYAHNSPLTEEECTEALHGAHRHKCQCAGVAAALPGVCPPGPA